MYQTFSIPGQEPPVLAKNKLYRLISEQNVSLIPEFTLESGVHMTNVPVAWKSWGKLNDNGDNCMVICHAFTGSADAEDWWGPLMGPGRAFDPSKFFIICFNALGSPYGSASPLTINPDTNERFGPEFPLVTIRDDVRLHRLILEQLGVKRIALVIGGSMGGMHVLEWAYMAKDLVKTFIPIATSGRHSAWCISWGEAQRQSVYSDPRYVGGYYSDDCPPNAGLAAARMSALLTYRSRNSFESRFGRKSAGEKHMSTPQSPPQSPREAYVRVHNDGHKQWNGQIKDRSQPPTNATTNNDSPMPTPLVFSAQSYLRYQGDKFVGRFDANCYIAITRKLDSHDLSRDRDSYEDVLSSMKQPALVIGIESDGLFTVSEQHELAEGLENAEMIVIQSPEGHDGFLLEFDQINRHILNFIKRELPDIYNTSSTEDDDVYEVKATKTSVFGEAEVDITQW